MNVVGWLGALLTLGGLAGYAIGAGYGIGTPVAYPGRAFSVTAFMIGLTLAAIAHEDAEATEEPSPEEPT